MNNAQHNDIQGVLIELFLSYIEGEKSTKEILAKAERLCLKNTLDKNLSKASEKILEIKKNYDRDALTEDDARYEITTVLVLLTK